MSYSTMAHALISYVESHLENLNIREMSVRFGFSDSYLRELFLKNVNIPLIRYYKRRKIMASAFELLHSDRKIIDIAFEYGFSNHESYMRAFQRNFGMTPDRFRRERPLIGRKQLDTGVFGLDRLVSKEKRSDGINMEQNHHETILYGIRKTEWGAYGSRTMFPICVKAVSEYLGDDVSYAYIMAATGAAFRLTWNRAEWDLSNIDIFHTLKESNDIYRYGAGALGREFAFLGRDENTKKEDFTEFIRSNTAKGFPVIALGIIGPPEPCIIAGYEESGDVVVGWNFFQHDDEYASDISFMDNGYFRSGRWWENADTQAVMCIGPVAGEPWDDKEIVKTAASIMEPRSEGSYAKGIAAYDAWKEMLLDEKWFENGAGYFEELSETCGEAGKEICRKIAKHFNRTGDIADEMLSLAGDWSNVEQMLQRLADRPFREKIAGLIDAAKAEDAMAYEQIRQNGFSCIFPGECL